MFRNLDCLACNWITFSSFRIIGPCLRFTLTKLFRLVPLSDALKVSPAGAGLTPELQEALAELLHHGRTDCAGLSPAMFVDRINELLFDAVGDAVLEMRPAGPAVIEDYIDDVKRIIL